ncbi:MAG TPA: hypothetical protein VLN49_11130 [Gemmatimonadaceae bacterium]|nr:hypothetical protein [Gemmatimonadaceae bacterium]
MPTMQQQTIRGTHRSPRLQAELERIARERLEAERQVSRVYRRELLRVCLECLGSSFLGVFCMGFALHTNDAGYGAIAWWGGMVVGYSGIALSLISAYIRGDRRGDW